MIYILYNPLANAGKPIDSYAVLESLGLAGDSTSKDLLTVDMPSFLAGVTKNDTLILFGGDGTLNHFVNNTRGIKIPCTVYLHHAGTGNDFLYDVAKDAGDRTVELTPYLENLPEVEINGNTYAFINGVGFGIDGEACVIAEEQKKRGSTSINYAAITVSLLLFRYKRPNATVTVDGVTKTYSRVWLASAMKGRYYGGGMMVAPDQDRTDSKISAVVMHGANRLKTLLVFTKIFKGEHVKHKEMVDIRKGHEITVEFDRPTALQIDGEVVSGVTSYTVRSKKV